MTDLADPPFARALPPGACVSLWRAPDGWSHRRYDRAGTGRGRLLFQAGRADSIEKYLPTLDALSAQGWAVTAFDWRGQGGSGRLGDGNAGHLEDFATLVADLAAFWNEWRTGDGPQVVVGHSMGGFVTLRALTEGVIDPAAAVLVAPMLGLRSPVGGWLGGRIAQAMTGRGNATGEAWARMEGPRYDRARQRRLTHDLALFADQQRWRIENPDLCLGSPSWTWVAQAFRATDALRSDPRLEQVDTPVQLLVADADRLVDARAARRVAARLRRAELVRFGPEAAHEILREVEPVRARALAAIDGFLNRWAPA